MNIKMNILKNYPYQFMNMYPYEMIKLTINMH